MSRDNEAIKDEFRMFVRVINDNDGARKIAEQIATAIQFSAGKNEFYVTIAEGAARFQEGRHPKPNIAVSTSPRTLSETIFGPKSITHFIADDELKVESGGENYLDLIDLDRIIAACGADLVDVGGRDE